MKAITLAERGPFKTRDIIKIVVEQASGRGGINLDAMRRRIRIIEALEKTPADADQMLLEDADHATLCQLISGFEFSVARPELLQIIDDVIKAQAPEVAKP